MTNFIYPFLIGFGIGVLLAPALGFGVYRRLVKRLSNHNNIIQTAMQLEKRRLSYDFGIDTEPREGAGPPGSIASLFVTRPGTLMLGRLNSVAPQPNKSMETVDNQGDRSSLIESEQSQPEANPQSGSSES